MTRYREEIETKPERDPVTCSQCDREATTATPEGGLCDEHAEELFRAMGWLPIVPIVTTLMIMGFATL